MQFFYSEVMDTQQEGGQGSPGGDTLLHCIRKELPVAGPVGVRLE